MTPRRSRDLPGTNWRPTHHRARTNNTRQMRDPTPAHQSGWAMALAERCRQRPAGEPALKVLPPANKPSAPAAAKMTPRTNKMIRLDRSMRPKPAAVRRRARSARDRFAP